MIRLEENIIRKLIQSCPDRNINYNLNLILMYYNKKIVELGLIGELFLVGTHGVHIFTNLSKEDLNLLLLTI